MDATPASPPALTRRQDLRTISLIGLAHGTSHFFHLLLPPLFPVFIREFGLSYSELGLLVSAFFIVSGIGQALAGFVVDRIGARPVLLAAMAFFAAAALAAASAQGFGGLMLAALLAGMGNAPFHPADFTVLNQRVSTPRLGHAFAVHGLSGNLGWTVEQMFGVGVSTMTGRTQRAAALWALAVLVVLVLARRTLGARSEERAVGGAAKGTARAPEHPLAFLRLPAVWLCFSFFFWSTAALSAVQSFAAPALAAIHALPIELTTFVVTGYMLCGAAGMVAGGFIVARVDNLERTIAWTLGASALLLLVVAGGVLPGYMAIGVASLAGFGTGLANPSRDMLIKRAAPPGATGRVYGTVYSGLDLGFAVAAPVFGWMMDQSAPGSIFVGAAAALLLGIGSASLVGRRRRATVLEGA